VTGFVVVRSPVLANAGDLPCRTECLDLREDVASNLDVESYIFLLFPQ
jgi:hypothetical protein